MAEFRKLSEDPKERDGNIALDDGRLIVDGEGNPVVVPYDKWLTELSQSPKKLEAFAKRCAPKKALHADADAPAEVTP